MELPIVEIVEEDVADNMLPAILIMLMRLYDAQMALLGAASPEMASTLMEMHAKGDYFCPPPAFAYEEQEESNDK